MPRKRAHPTAGSVLSSASTESTVSSSTTTVDIANSTISGWMYWRRDDKCWTKVFTVLRKNYIWLMRSESATSFASPLIQMAVIGVERTTLRSFRITGPSNESMELHLYDEEEGWTWFDALLDATNCVQQDTTVEDHEVAHRRSSLPRLSILFRSHSSLEAAYRGTLVLYNQDRQGSRLRQLWRSKSQRIMASLCKRVEDIVDRFETAQSRPTLC